MFPTVSIDLAALAPADTPVGRYLRHVQEAARSHGVALQWGGESTVPYNGQEGIRVSGFFVETPRPTLAVATGKPLDEWLPILVHEACHMDQWAEGAPEWAANTLADGREAVDWLDEWCAGGRELAAPVLDDVIDRAMAVELDCERRVLAALEQFGLPIDRAEYAQRANAYVHFYRHVARIRRWNPPDQAPYQLEAVWRTAPTHLVSQPPFSLLAAYETAYPLGG